MVLIAGMDMKGWKKLMSDDLINREVAIQELRKGGINGKKIMEGAENNERD